MKKIIATKMIGLFLLSGSYTFGAEQYNLGNNLSEAIVSGNSELLGQLLQENNIDVNARGLFSHLNSYWTLLGVAATCGSPNIVAFLLAQGACADDTFPGISFLNYALQWKKTDIAVILIKHKAALDVTPFSDYMALSEAILTNNTKVLQSLLAFGVDPHCLFYNYNPFSTKKTMLMESAANSSTETVLFLLQQGIDVSQRDNQGFTASDYTENETIFSYLQAVAQKQTPLMRAALTSSHKKFSDLLFRSEPLGKKRAPEHFLVRKKALSLSSVNKKDHNGWNAFMYAVSANQQENAALLLDYGSESSNQDREGRTALHIAVARGQYAIIPFLLENLSESTINAPDLEGNTALHDAAFFGNMKTCKAFFELENESAV